MLWLIVGPTGVYLLNFFCSVFSLIYCWVLIFAFSPCYILIYTGPRSAVGNVSGVTDCRSRGREFDPGPVPHFHGD